MEFRGSHYAYRGSEESVYGQNLIMDQAGHHRQPSYLAAIDIARPTEAVEPIQEFSPFCSFGVSKGMGDQIEIVDKVENFSQSAEHYNQITSCHQKFPSSDAENLSMAETRTRYGNVKGRIGGFKAVGDFGKVSPVHSQLAGPRHNNELHLNYFNSMKAGNMVHRPRHDVMTSQNVKNIPRAVVAPITRCSVNYNYSESDRFLSLPKTVKLVGSKSDKNRNEAVHSSNYSELFSFESDNAKKVTVCNAVHGKVWSDMNHPDHAKPRQGNQVRQAELLPYDGSDNDFDYIHPQKVEQILSLQRSRKMSSSCGRKISISDVTGQISVSTVAAVMPDCHSINARKVAAGSCHEMIDRLSNVSLVPCYTTHEVDRISTSSSSTKRSSVNSHCDSGYSGSRHSDSLKSSFSQSPELCTSLAFHHHVPSSTREEHFIQEQNPTAGLTTVRSVSYQEDSIRHPKYAGSLCFIACCKFHGNSAIYLIFYAQKSSGVIIKLIHF